MMNDSFDGVALPSIRKIKECLEKISELGQNIIVPIANVDRKLYEELRTLTYDMFCYHKLNNKSFTVLGDSKLKKLRLQEDEAVSESDSLLILDFLSENLLDAFAELVSCSYSNSKRARAQLYVGNFYSRYSGKLHKIFFSSYRKNIYLFSDGLSKIKLSVYLTDYFSSSDLVNKMVKKICDVSCRRASFIEKQQDIMAIIEEFNRETENRHDLIFGAITFLDFLGWKGLWRSKDTDDVLKDVSDLIEDFRNTLEKLSQKYYKGAVGISISSLISISDTIAVFSPKTSNIEICDLLKLHAEFAKYVLEKCCTEGFAIRGAINYGQYSVEKNIMIGPGIDECASWHEMGNWIGVHLTPTAQINWEQEHGPEGKSCICGYKIPMKSGLQADYCVQWNLSKKCFYTLATSVSALLPEIAAKYMNTQKFLRERVWKEEPPDGEK